MFLAYFVWCCWYFSTVALTRQPRAYGFIMTDKVNVYTAESFVHKCVYVYTPCVQSVEIPEHQKLNKNTSYINSTWDFFV